MNAHFENPLHLPWLSRSLLFALLVVSVSVILHFARPLTPRTLLLLIPRLLALGIAWTMLAFEPTLVQVRDETTPSRILIAVDMSTSMEACDPQRTPAESLGLSVLFGDIGDRDIDALPRREIVRRILADTGVNLVGKLAEAHRVELVGFHDALIEKLDPMMLAAAFESPNDTDLRLPLRRLLEKSPGDNAKHLGVILFTDGQHNVGPSPLDLARELGVRKLPIYAVALGSKIPPSDIAVLELSAPKQIFKDAEVAVSTRIRVQGIAAQPIIVELFDATGERRLLERKTLTHSGRDGVESVKFTTKFSEVGLRRLEVKATPTLPDVKEVSEANNKLATLTRVTEDKIRVLLVDGEARWEYQYLVNALGRDADIRLDRLLFDAPSIGSIADDKREAAGLPMSRWPDEIAGKEDPLWKYDCILLGDVPPERLPLAVQQRLEKYVADREGTLVISAGKRSMPMALVGAPFAKLIPVESPRPIPSKEGFLLEWTPSGRGLPFANLGDRDEDSSKRWDELPRLFWGVTGKLRPGAQALAIAKGTEDALVVQQNVGLGRVLWVGVDGTWRWRFRVGDRDHHRFWGQVARWAGDGPGAPEGDRVADFGSRDPAYASGQAVDLFLRLGAEVADLDPATAKMKVTRIGPDGKESSIASFPLGRSENRPRHWSAKAPKLPPGDYRVELDVPELVGKLPVDAGTRRRERFTVLPPERGEAVDLATNWELLRTLAEQSGGRLFAAHEADQLPALLESRIAIEERRQEWRTWRDAPFIWWVFGVLLGLLTIEWTCRKIVGLA